MAANLNKNFDLKNSYLDVVENEAYLFWENGQSLIVSFDKDVDVVSEDFDYWTPSYDRVIIHNVEVDRKAFFRTAKDVKDSVFNLYGKDKEKSDVYKWVKNTITEMLENYKEELKELAA